MKKEKGDYLLLFVRAFAFFAQVTRIAVNSPASSIKSESRVLGMMLASMSKSIQ
jgi:hypothetical protein